MVAVISFIKDKRKGIFAKIMHYLFPKVLKTIYNIKLLPDNIIFYYVTIPVCNENGTVRCLNKLIREMRNDNIYEFICCNGKLSEYLINNGFKRLVCREYLIKQINNAVKTLANETGIMPSRLTISIYDRNEKNDIKPLVESACRLAKNVTFITPFYERYNSLIMKLYEDYGTAAIITDSFDAVRRSHIVISVNNTRDLLRNTSIPIGAALFNLDEFFKPEAFLPYTVIDAFSFYLPEGIKNLCPDDLPMWEFAAALALNGLSDIDITKIENYYSFGNILSVKSVADGIKMLDRKRYV